MLAEDLLERSWRPLGAEEDARSAAWNVLGSLLGPYSDPPDRGNSPREGNLPGSGPGGGREQGGGTGKKTWGPLTPGL